MPSTMTCPACGTPIHLIEKYAGRTARCPKCNYPFVMPPPGDAAYASGQAAPTPVRDYAPADAPAAPPPRPRPPARARGGRVMRWATFTLAALGFVLGATALGLIFFHDPLGGGMGRYRFSTPRDSLMSALQIEQNKDIRAEIQLNSLRSDRLLAEKLKTLEVHREAEWKGNKILFIVYEEKGVKKYETPTFEKDADTGYWFPKYVSSFEVDDKDLSQKMTDWQQKGETKPPVGGLPPDIGDKDKKN